MIYSHHRRWNQQGHVVPGDQEDPRKQRNYKLHFYETKNLEVRDSTYMNYGHGCSLNLNPGGGGCLGRFPAFLRFVLQFALYRSVEYAHDQG